MPKPVPPRLDWAFDRLAVDPASHLLEIGCGHGVLAGLLAARLTTGTLTAIDRSETMIAVAEKRNAVHVAAGRVSFQTIALADADFGDRRFDRILAVNVNLFWITPRRELDVVRRLLKTGARLELFYEPPSVAQVQKILVLLGEQLAINRFVVASQATSPLDKALGIHVVAQPG